MDSPLKIFFKLNFFAVFYFEILVDLHAVVRNYTEGACVPLICFPEW